MLFLINSLIGASVLSLVLSYLVQVIDVGKAVKGKFAVTLKALGSGTAVDFLVVLVARVDVHGIDQAAAPGDEMQAGVEQSAVQPVLE
jgi:hypothetical protein